MPSNPKEQLSASRLTIRLGAIKRNYLKLTELTENSVVGAAVKANGYGLGTGPVAEALWDVGCRHFFVAYVSEGVEVRQSLPHANIYVFNGVMPGTTESLITNDLVPLIISLEQLSLWRDVADQRTSPLGVGLHFDTGMGRTGITLTETQQLLADPTALAGLELKHVLTHMASADEPASTQPEEQLQRFLPIANHFGEVPASISNSAGLFRGSSFHLDMIRAGIAIYGGTPIAGSPNPMEQTVVLEAPILQFKDVSPGDRIGYGATYEVTKPERHATLTVGYADGYLRSKSNSGSVSVGGHLCPIVGRVSMDLTIVDITDVPDELIYLGAPAEMIGPNRPIDDVATAAGTIANELLTELGTRYDVVFSHD